MIDITKTMNLYRECARHIWNNYYLEQMVLREDWDLCDEYDELCTSLFSSLVLRTIDKTSYKKSCSFERDPKPLDFIKVIPSSEAGVPIHVNREINCSGYWDYPVNIVTPSDVDMRFVDYFDFNKIAFRDFQYCRVRIFGSVKYKDIIGRDALINSNNLTIQFDS